MISDEPRVRGFTYRGCHCRGNTPGNTSPLLGTTRPAADTSAADTTPAVDMSAAPAADDRASTYGNT